MNAIVVTDKQWAIGRSGDLLFSLPGDMKHFRHVENARTNLADIIQKEG